MAKNIIFIYNDNGTANVKDYEKALRSTLDKNYAIKQINATTLMKTDILKKACLLVMPGGADKPYCALLNGVGNKKIKAFVEQGGYYLGICAGAYYGASYIDYDPHSDDSIQGERELKFFDGIAYGPLLKRHIPNAPTGITATKITLPFNDSCSYVYYNGGPTFLPKDESTAKKTKVLAYYVKEDDPWYDETLFIKYPQLPAIITSQIGKGQIVLSGIHLENTMFDAYNASENFMHRRDLLSFILKEVLGMKVKISDFCRNSIANFL